MSSTITSGFDCGATDRRVRPSETVPTTSNSGSRSRLKASTTKVWSSANRTPGRPILDLQVPAKTILRSDAVAGDQPAQWMLSLPNNIGECVLTELLTLTEAAISRRGLNVTPH